jgi:DNA-binding IscR family transcriptional regulator
MLKELKGMEYTLEVLRVFHKNPGQHDSKQIAAFIIEGGRIDPSVTYLAKILPRMKRAGLLLSSEHGYEMVRPINEITVDSVLDLCPMPETSSPVYRFCSDLKRAVESNTIDDFYDFT